MPRPNARPHATAGRHLPLQAYLDGLPDDALLSAEQERALAHAIADGDQEARARLIRANLRLVVRIARDYQGRGLGLDDLVGEGNLGLIRAAQDYDPGFGTRFSTYAAYWIKQAIRHALTTTGSTIRLPAHMVNHLTRWRRAERTLRRELGREPSFDETADRLDLNEAHRDLVARALRARKLAPGGAGDEDEPASWNSADSTDPAPSPEQVMEDDEERRAVLRRLDRLDDRERAILSMRFGLDGVEPQTLKQVGFRLGITREWVRKIEQRAVEKLASTTPPAPHAPRRRALQMA